MARSSSSPAVEGGDYAAPAKNEDNNGGAMMTANSGGEGGGAGGGSSSSSAGTTPGHVSGARTPAEGDERKGREREKEAEDSKGVLGTKEGGGEEGEEAGSEKRPHRVENSHELHGSDNNVHPILSPRQKDGGGYGDHEKLQLTSALIPPLPHEQTPTTPWSREGGGSTARDVEGGEGRSSVSFPRASPRGHGSSTEGVAVGAMKSPALRFEASPPSSRAGRGGGGHHRSETGPALRTMPSSASSASPTQMTVSILGESTRFTAEVRPGHKIRLEGKDYTVLKVFSDTHLLAKPPSDLPLRTIGSSPAPTAPASRCTSVPRVGSEPLIAGAASRDRDRTPVIGKIVRAESAREAGRVSRSAAMAGVSRDKKKKRSGGGGGEEEEEAQSDSSGGGERWVGVCPDRGASFSSRSSSCSGSSASITYNGQSDSHVDAMRGGEGEEEAQDGERGEEEGKGQEKRMGAGGDWKKGHESSSSTEWGQDDQSRRSGTAHRDAASSFHPSLDGEKGGKDEEASRALRELGEEGLRRRRGKAGGERGEEETKRGEPQRWGGGGGGGGREEDKDDLIRPLHYRHHHDHDQQRRRLHEKQRKLSAVSYHPYKASQPCVCGTGNCQGVYASSLSSVLHSSTRQVFVESCHSGALFSICLRVALQDIPAELKKPLPCRKTPSSSPIPTTSGTDNATCAPRVNWLSLLRTSCLAPPPTSPKPSIHTFKYRVHTICISIGSPEVVACTLKRGWRVVSFGCTSTCGSAHHRYHNALSVVLSPFLFSFYPSARSVVLSFPLCSDSTQGRSERSLRSCLSELS